MNTCVIEMARNCCAHLRKGGGGGGGTLAGVAVYVELRPKDLYVPDYDIIL